MQLSYLDKQNLYIARPAFRGSVSWQKNEDLWSRLDKYDQDLAHGVDDLIDVMTVLREEKNYAMSDRLRTIIGRLARARRDDIPSKLTYTDDGHPCFNDDLSLNVHQATKWT